MNINEALYNNEAVAKEIEAYMGKGYTYEQAVSTFWDEVITQTKEEAQQGICHGEMIELQQ